MDWYPADSLPGSLVNLARKTVISCLQLIPGSKDLVIESSLIAPLDLICGVTLLKEAGVDKIYKLEPGSRTPGQSKTCCFLSRSSVTSIQTMVELISADESSSSSNKREYYLLSVPHTTVVCEKILEEGGVYGQLTQLDCPVLFFPLDTDVISLERNSLFADVFLEHDKTQLQDVSHSLLQLQQLVGCIPNIHIQGNVSREVATFTKHLLKDDPFVRNKKRSHITDLLLIDRDMDLVSILASQLTYEGVLDEAFGIECGKIFLPDTIAPPKGLKHGLDSRDAVFASIRDLHLSAALVRLKETGASFKQEHESRQGMNLSDMKEFIVTQMKDIQIQYKSLNMHITACEEIMKQKKELQFADQLQAERSIIENRDLKEAAEFVESFIVRQVCQYTSLRLLCLLCISQEGLPVKQYRYWSQLFAQSFGHEHVTTFANLRKLKLFYPQNSQSIKSAANVLDVTLASRKRFREVCKRFNQIPRLAEGSAYDVKNPHDAAFVFGGAYTPLTVPLLDCYVLNSLEGCTKKDLCNIFPESCCETWRSSCSGDRVRRDEDRKLVAIYFVGGVTYAEITAVRFWARTRRVKVVIFTTGVLNGSTLIRSLMPSQ